MGRRPPGSHARRVGLLGFARLGRLPCLPGALAGMLAGALALAPSGAAGPGPWTTGGLAAQINGAGPVEAADSGVAESEVPGVPLPPAALEWRLRDLEGRDVTLRELLGRPLVINVWATWCLPCVAELRSFERLARSLEDADVGFVLVAPQDRAAVADWVRRRGYSLPFYVEGTRIPDAFGLEAVPTTWVLDARGRVLLRHRGSADWDRADVRALLRRLAAGGD